MIVTIDQVDDPPVFLSSPFSSSNRNNKISWNDESEYIYHVRAYDADWPFYGVPTLTLTSQLPEWLTFVSEEMLQDIFGASNSR